MAQSKPPVRRLALQILGDWEKSETFAADLVRRASEKSGLEPRDRAFLQQLVYGVIRNLSVLDHTANSLASGRLKPKLRAVLRLGLYEALLGESAPHALVNEAVNLSPGWAKKAVNAILRRAVREKTAILSSWEDLPPEVRWSVPRWLWQRWVAEFGRENAEFLVRWNNRPAETYVRVNAITGNVDGPPESEPVPGFPGFFRVEGPLPRDWLDQGRIYAQDPSTSLAVDLLDARSGHTVLDACAAPGGKSFAIALAMGGEGRIVAVDKSEPRLRRMRGNFERLQLGLTETARFDWLNEEPWPDELPQTFDRILVDTHCSNTGVIRRRIDVSWRLKASDFALFHREQSDLLDRLIPFLKPGGRLVYSTCSLDQEENEAVAEALAARQAGVRLVEQARVLPWREGFDGAFAAVFEHQ